MAVENDDEGKTQSFSVITPGLRIGRYEVERQLGAGGMGSVYLAQDTSLRRPVALKFLSPRFCANEAFKARFMREARSAAALNHPNIVTVYEVGEYHDQLFIAMEYLRGSSLADLISLKPMPEPAIVDIMLQICDGLKAAHASKIIHRDIKPDNIHVDENGRVKLLDFGLAKGGDEGNLTEAGTTLGTANYMSPEQAQGLEVDVRTDLFSLGVVMYEMVSGKQPFRRANVPATMYAILHEEPPLLADVCPGASPQIQQVVNRAIEKDPSLRFPTVQDLIEDLTAIATGRALTAQTSSVTALKPAVRSLAVLYLHNLGTASEDYLCYGITEDLIVDLTRLGNIRVTSMRSILKYKDSTEELADIASQLEVDLILDGSIMRSPESVRVSAQLIDISKETILWAERWEEKPDSLPRVKQALARGVSNALGIGSSLVEAAQIGTPETDNPEAYDLYLQGKYAFDHKKKKEDVGQALKFYNRALSIEPDLIAAKAGVAEILVQRGENEGAIEELELALAACERGNKVADQARIFRLMAEAQIGMSNWEDATNYANQSVQYCRKLGDLVGESDGLAILIDILRRRAKFDRALQLFERTLEINQQLEDHQKTTKALNTMGSVHLSKGEYERARQLFEEALVIARRRENRSLEAACLCNIGLTFRYTGDSDEALDYYEQALQIFKQLGDEPHKATLFYNIAVIYLARGEYEQSKEYFERAATTHKVLGDKGNFALAHNNRSAVLALLGQYDRSIKGSEKALVISKELDFPVGIVVANDTLGFAHFCKGEIAAAEGYFQTALVLAEHSELQWHLAQTHSNFSEMYFVHENYERALQYACRGEEIAETINEAEFIIKTSAYRLASSMMVDNNRGGLEALAAIRQQAESLGDPLYKLITTRLLGQMMVTKPSGDDDVTKGRQLLRSALAMASKMKLAHEINWISDIIAKSESAP